MKPRAFFVIGPAGSGKSTVSKKIAQHYRAAYLDKDSMVTAFTELLLQANGFDKDERDNNAVLPVGDSIRFDYACISHVVAVIYAFAREWLAFGSSHCY